MSENTSTPGTSNPVQFNSTDINKKEQPKYFNNIKEKPNHFKNFIKFCFAGRHKFVTISVLALVAIGATLLILWLTIWRFPSEPKEPVLSWEQTITDVSKQAYAILNSDSDTSYIDAVNYFDEQVEAYSNNPEQLFGARLARAQFLIYKGGNPQSGLNDLLTVDEDTLNDWQKASLYISIGYAYDLLDNTEGLATYQEKYDALPKSVTTEGDSEE